MTCDLSKVVYEWFRSSGHFRKTQVGTNRFTIPSDVVLVLSFPKQSMYGIFTYIYLHLHLQLKTTKCHTWMVWVLKMVPQFLSSYSCCCDRFLRAFFHIMEPLIHGIHGGGGLLGEILISLGCYISLSCQYIYRDDDDDDDDDDNDVKSAQDYQRIRKGMCWIFLSDTFWIPRLGSFGDVRCKSVKLRQVFMISDNEVSGAALRSLIPCVAFYEMPFDALCILFLYTCSWHL